MDLLRQGPHRYGELRHSIPDVSEKMLAQSLRELQADGLVYKETELVVPPRVTYQLTQLGHSLEPLLREFIRFGLNWRGHQKPENPEQLEAPEQEGPPVSP